MPNAANQYSIHPTQPQPTSTPKAKASKLSQLPLGESGKEVHVCYCKLCEEILTLSTRKIDPRKIILVFDGKCPECGFPLGRVLGCELLRITAGISLLTHPKISSPNCLLRTTGQAREFKINKADALSMDSKPNLTTGMMELDQLLPFRLGQLVALYGQASHPFSSLLCVRATLPQPLGLDSDVIFIDGGNIFDAYSTSEHAIRHEIEAERTLARIHLSRAFTYHQLGTLINERLPQALDHFNAKLAIVSDITLLYCDPDIQDKRDALNVFRKDIRTLLALAEQKRTLIVTTNLETRNRRMNAALLQTAHVSAELEDHGTFTQLTLSRHPFTPQLKAIISLNKQTLESYMNGANDTFMANGRRSRNRETEKVQGQSKA
jgi:hypothetical protein